MDYTIWPTKPTTSRCFFAIGRLFCIVSRYDGTRWSQIGQTIGGFRFVPTDLESDHALVCRLAPNREQSLQNDQFGGSVSISGDGPRVAVGAIGNENRPDKSESKLLDDGFKELLMDLSCEEEWM